MKTLLQKNVAIVATMMLGLTSLHAQEPAAGAAEPGKEAAAEALSPEEQQFRALLDSITWAKSGDGKIGNYATINIPEGYIYTEGAGTMKLMKAYGNLVSGGELGYISPDNLSWFAVFEFDECGYVKDDEKDALDATKIMKQMQEGQKEANKQLKSQGMPTLEVIGWHTPPFYNPDTKNLEWAIRLRGEGGGETINYKTKLLGRRGVMDVVLVCEEAELSTIVPEYQKLLAGYKYQDDHSYAAFTKGDKIAEYGLTGLIVGGGLLAAAKTGLLTKLWKPIGFGLLAIVAFLKRIFGRKSDA
jgi:uncharacterized membrane-anchored protein